MDKANFCMSEVKLGLIPATISPYVIRAKGTRARSATVSPFAPAGQKPECGWRFLA